MKAASTEARVGDVAAHAVEALGGVARAVRHDDVVAGLGEGPGDRQADAAVAAGDEDGAWLAHAVEPSGLPLGSRKRATYSGTVPLTRHRDDSPQSVTSAPESRTEDQARRLKHYLVTMGIRTACFVLLVVIDHPIRWVFAFLAVFLPFIAVVAANAVAPRVVGPGAPRACRPSTTPAASRRHRTTTSRCRRASAEPGSLSRRWRTSGARAARSRAGRCRGRASWPTSRSMTRSASSASVAPVAHRAAQVDLLAGEQAVAQLAVGGEPDPVAGGAERRGDAGDDADRLRARRRRGRARPGRCPAPATGVSVNRSPSRSRISAWDTIGERSQRVLGVERHLLDEAQLVAAVEAPLQQVGDAARR